MKQPARELVFLSDPGHGWLIVDDAQELITLGIAEQISGYSYLENGIAYLEEDEDAQRYLDALTRAGYSERSITSRYTPWFDRNKPAYHAENITRQEEPKTVQLIASGYEWLCAPCDHINKVIEITEIVTCELCGRDYRTDDDTLHAYG